MDRKAFSAARWRFLDALARADVEHVEFRIAYLIVSRINQGQRWAYPSLETLAAEVGCSRSTAKRAIRSLVDGAWLVRHRIGSGKLASEYGIDWGRWSQAERLSGSKAEVDDIPF